MPKSLPLTKKALSLARKRGRVLSKHEPDAVDVWYDREHDVIVILLKNGGGVAIPRQHLQGLQDATPEQLHDVVVVGGGSAIVFDKLHEGFHVPHLVRGLFGSQRWMRALAAQQAGQVKSEAKTAAARANGAKGGRPRKKHPYQYAS